MLPTFVIALREGLEGALIVGIIAAFLNQRGRRDLLRLLWIGVAAATGICLAVGVGLHIYSAELPQRQQEGLETVVGTIAVFMVTYMVIWMRRHSRGLKQQLEGAAELAMESGSGLALVTMAFLAVFREGFETAVFMLAAFNEAASPATAGGGAILGLAVAILLGYGLYRGGIRLNLAKFFRATGVVLVLVAGGLVVSALHTAHEAGWLDAGQSASMDLTWLVSPGSVQSSLLTGMLGLQPRPVLIEVLGWLLYVVPVALYTAWPSKRTLAHRTIVRLAAGLCVAGSVLAVAALVVRPAAPSKGAPVVPLQMTPSSAAASSASPVSVMGDRASVRLVLAGRIADVTLTRTAGTALTRTFSVSGLAQPPPAGLPSSATLSKVLQVNGGRLPLGARAGTGRIGLTYSTKVDVQAVIDTISSRLLSLRVMQRTTAVAALPTGAVAVGAPGIVSALTAPADEQALLAAVLHDRAGREHRTDWTVAAVAAAVVALFGALGALGAGLAMRSQRARTNAMAGRRQVFQSASSS